MENLGKMELEILDVKVKKGDKGNKYVEFSGKSTKSGDVFKKLTAVGITGANLVKDYEQGDIINIQHSLEVNYDEDKNVEISVHTIGYSEEKTKSNNGFLRGTLEYDPKKKKSKGKDIAEVYLRVTQRDCRGKDKKVGKGNTLTFTGDNGKEMTSRQMFKIRITEEEHLELLFSEIGKREKSCTAGSEIYIEYELKPHSEEGFVNITPTHLEILSLSSASDKESWEIPSEVSKKSSDEEVDYSEMKPSQLRKLAINLGVDEDDAEDMSKSELIREIKKRAPKKAKSSDEEVDYSEMKPSQLRKLAIKLGVDEDDAEDMSKSELIKEIKKRAPKKEQSSDEEVDYSEMKPSQLRKLAIKLGVDEDDAEDMSKSELIKEIKKRASKKAKSSDEEVDYSEMKPSQLRKLAIKLGVDEDDAEDMSKSELIKEIKKRASKKEQSSDEEVDYSEMKTSQLRKLAIKLGIDEDDVDDMSKSELIKAIKKRATKNEHSFNGEKEDDIDFGEGECNQYHYTEDEDPDFGE